MCGRFAITLSNDAMARLFDAAPDNDLPLIPNYNVCPTNRIHVVTGDGTGLRRLRAMRWGFLPHWYKAPNDGPLLINARAETIADKPAFAAACRTRRCLIPADGFYEWARHEDGTKLPHFVHRADGAPLVMAGIWQEWGEEDTRQETCAVVTTQANATIADIHHRMPVIPDPADWPLWLGERGKGAATLMTPSPADVLSVHRVDPAVNSNRASGAALVLPFSTGPV